MGILKSNSRRSFIRNMGAGVSAGVASVAGVTGAVAGAADDPARRAARLEEERMLRRSHQAFEQAMDKGSHEEVIGMFADDAEVVFNGGLYRGRQGVARLFGGLFPSGKTGARMAPAPGFELTADQQRDRVEVARDLRSAVAVFPYSIQVGIPVEAETSLVAMARLHGEGVQTWWEGGLYNVSYRKDAAGAWKISRLAYETLSRADYRAGRSYARPISVERLSTRFPENQQGPDELV